MYFHAINKLNYYIFLYLKDIFITKKNNTICTRKYNVAEFYTFFVHNTAFHGTINMKIIFYNNMILILLDE